jgi:hypothetical protein
VEIKAKQRIKREGRQLEGRRREDKDGRKKDRKKERKDKIGLQVKDTLKGHGN